MVEKNLIIQYQQRQKGFPGDFRHILRHKPKYQGREKRANFLNINMIKCCLSLNGYLHTVEVTGSNPVSPIPLLSITCVVFLSGKIAVVPKFEPGGRFASPFCR